MDFLLYSLSLIMIIRFLAKNQKQLEEFYEANRANSEESRAQSNYIATKSY